MPFSGFGWDYGGSANWDEGGVAVGIHLLPIPGTDASVVSDPRYPEILGDRVVTSDHPLVRQMTIMVDRIDLAGPGERRTEYECPPNA